MRIKQRCKLIGSVYKGEREAEDDGAIRRNAGLSLSFGHYGAKVERGPALVGILTLAVKFPQDKVIAYVPSVIYPVLD